LSATNKEKENNTIELILYNNKYDNSILKKFTAIKKKEYTGNQMGQIHIWK